MENNSPEKDSLDLITDTVVTLARNSVPFEREVHIHGLLVITVDGRPSVAAHIDQKWSQSSMKQLTPSSVPVLKQPRVKQESDGYSHNKKVHRGYKADLNDTDASNGDELSDLVSPSMLKVIGDPDTNVRQCQNSFASYIAVENQSIKSPVRQKAVGVGTGSQQKRTFTKLTSVKEEVNQCPVVKKQHQSTEQDIDSLLKSQVRKGRTPNRNKDILTPPRSRSNISPLSPSSAPVGDGSGFGVISTTTYACNICGHTFKHKRSLPRHRKDAHGRISAKVGDDIGFNVISTTTYACNICSRTFNHKRSLPRHQKDAHGRMPFKRAGKASQGNTVKAGSSVENADNEEEEEEEGKDAEEDYDIEKNTETV